MSFNMGLDNIQQLIVLALTMVFIFAVFFSDISPTYKIVIGALVFGLLFLTTLANQVVKQQKPQRAAMQ
ncbi:hypothetical protein KAI12_02140 [Candidatus Bathyarchaeota archaeon]|nr:hypothetical protein [Candidatus Bathyarchaeota archaeon]